MLIWGMILSLASLAAGSSLKILGKEHSQVAGDLLRVMAPRAKPGKPTTSKSERTTELNSELGSELDSEPPLELSSEQPSVTEQTTKFLEESEARIAVRDTAPHSN